MDKLHKFLIVPFKQRLIWILRGHVRRVKNDRNGINPYMILIEPDESSRTYFGSIFTSGVGDRQLRILDL